MYQRKVGVLHKKRKVKNRLTRTHETTMSMESECALRGQCSIIKGHNIASNVHKCKKCQTNVHVGCGVPCEDESASFLQAKDP